MRSFFLRALNYRKGEEILNLFGEINQNLALNKYNLEASDEEQEVLLKSIRVELYKEFIQSCLKKKAFEIADIVYSEYMEEVTETDVNDLLGMEISCLKNDIESFESYLNDSLNPEGEEVEK